MITNFWWTVLASTVGQSIAYIIFQGFVRSYLGIQSEEDVQRLFDKIANFIRKLKGKPPIQVKIYNEGRLLKVKEICKLQSQINKLTSDIIDLDRQREEVA